MDINEALEITGFASCEFKSDGEDLCKTCDKLIKKGANVYYERTCYENDEGEYHCKKCTIEMPMIMEKEIEEWLAYERNVLKSCIEI